MSEPEDADVVEQAPRQFNFPGVRVSPALRSVIGTGRRRLVVIAAACALLVTAAALVTFQMTEGPRTDPRLAALITEVTTVPVGKSVPGLPGLPASASSGSVDSSALLIDPGNTHQIAQAIAPETRVVYADYDPIVLAHARALLTSSDAGATEYIDADLRSTSAILGQAGKLLDFTQPVAVTLLAILHAIPDSDDPYAIVAKVMDAVPPGSYLALSHPGSDLIPPRTLQEMRDVAHRMSQQQYTHRTREEVARFLTGTDLVEPGIVPVEEWRPEPGGTGEAGQSRVWGAVGRRR